MSHEIKAAELLNQRPKPSVQLDTILVPIESREGFVFAMCAIERKGSEGLSVCRRIREQLERIARTIEKDANAQHTFEQFLATLNTDLALAVKSGEWSFPIETFNGIVGIATEGEMYLSGTGDITALFLHRAPDHRYQVFNLSRSIQTEQALPTWEKAFAVVLDGEIHPGDVLCLANEDLLRVVGNQELNPILATIPPKSAVAKIRQYFPPQTDLALLAIQARDPKSAPTEQAQPLASLSVEQFQQTSSETSEILEDKKPGLVRLIQRKLKRKPKVGEQRTTGGRRTWGKLRSITFFLAKIFRFFLKHIRPRIRWTKRFFARLTKRQERGAALKELGEKTKDAITSPKTKYRSLPKTAKRLSLAAAAILVVFIVSLTMVAQNKAEQDAIDDYDSLVAAVEEKQDQAEAAGIYRDEGRSRELFNEALELANALPAETPERQATKDRLNKEITAALDELRKIVAIPAPPIAATFQDVTPGHLAEFDDEIYHISREGALTRLNADEKQLEPQPTSTELTATLTSTDADGLLVFDGEKVLRLDPTDGTVTDAALAPEENIAWKDVRVYAERVYVLTESDGATQIVRYRPANNGYTTPFDWIRSRSSDLSDATSITIDGTVFVLSRNGDIVRFANGSEVGWSPALVEPPLENASRIWTSAESDHVYVLDAATKRVVVFGKRAGSLIAQYRSDTFGEATDFLIDEENKTIYLLTDTTIYAFTASQI